jgi:hypothetical protein
MAVFCIACVGSAEIVVVAGTLGVIRSITGDPTVIDQLRGGIRRLGPSGRKIDKQIVDVAKMYGVFIRGSALPSVGRKMGPRMAWRTGG